MNKFKSTLAAAVLLAAGAAQAEAGVIFSEGFDDVAGLVGAGWQVLNFSDPVGSTEWFQGNTGVFTAHAGPDDSYVAANFLASEPGGDVALFLLAPEMELRNGDVINFWTRTDVDGVDFGDSLQIGIYGEGLLDAINPVNDIGGYPTEWTEFNSVIDILPGPTVARFGFLYIGPADILNYIGIDSLSLIREDRSVPEPGSMLLLGLGLAGLGLARRRG
jgi:PEP-CTERM motif